MKGVARLANNNAGNFYEDSACVFLEQGMHAP
jgi:hypothetical protein